MVHQSPQLLWQPAFQRGCKQLQKTRQLNEQDMNEDIEHFADKLISENNHWIYDYYLNKGSDILNEFGGKPAYEKIERITKKLKTHGGDKLVDRYTKDLKSKFPERQAIFQSK